MYRVCGWCKRILGVIRPLDDKSITHGMCADCEMKMNEQVDEMEVEKK